MRAAVRLFRGPGSVGGQGQHRQLTAQLAAPVRDLRVQHVVAQPVALPLGVVGELRGRVAEGGSCPWRNAS